MSDRNVKRQLSGLPSGKNTFADMHFSVRHIAPKPEGENPTEESRFFATAWPQQKDVADAVERWLAGA